MKFLRFGNVQTFSGTLLLNLLCPMLITSMPCKYSIPCGKSPINILYPRSNTVVVFNIVISSGRHPDSLLCDTTNSSSFPAIWPILAGMQPMRSLSAITTTEAGELPRLSGMVE